jgi:hypothetical protein
MFTPHATGQPCISGVELSRILSVGAGYNSRSSLAKSGWSELTSLTQHHQQRRLGIPQGSQVCDGVAVFCLPTEQDHQPSLLSFLIS